VQKLVSTQQLHSNIANKETSIKTRSFDTCSAGIDLVFVQCAGNNSSALDEGRGQPLTVGVNVSRKEKSKVRGWGVLALFGKEGRMPHSLPNQFHLLGPGYMIRILNIHTKGSLVDGVVTM